MKTIATVLALFLVLPATLWGAEAVPQAPEQQVLEIQVQGMTCPFCVYGVEKNLGKLSGVEKAQASLESKKVRVIMRPGQTADIERIKQVIRDAGFSPEAAAVRSEGK